MGTYSISTNHFIPLPLLTMAEAMEAMGDVVTIDNFGNKMPLLDHAGDKKQLFGLVDMGRQAFLPIPEYESVSDRLK